MTLNQSGDPELCRRPVHSEDTAIVLIWKGRLEIVKYLTDLCWIQFDVMFHSIVQLIDDVVGIRVYG